MQKSLLNVNVLTFVWKQDHAQNNATEQGHENGGRNTIFDHDNVDSDILSVSRRVSTHTLPFRFHLEDHKTAIYGVCPGLCVDRR